ncbi:hypothetical protein BH23GEM10_BH23GEM10_17060 [soil metagenome]
MIVAGTACLPTACTEDSAPSLSLPEPVTLTAPALPGSAQPFVDAADGTFIVSWTEPTGEGHALRFAILGADGTWTEPRTVVTGDNWFVNWADFPSVVALPGAQLAAHWLQRSGPGTYAYDVMISQSADGGATWSDPVRPHGDGTQTEHGFVSLFPHGDVLGAVWLDGRRYAGSDGMEASNEMTLHFTTVPAGAPAPELLVDARVCDCCQTAAAITSNGPIVAYRDRTMAEIRDISVIRLVDGAWTEPAPLHADGWHIAGCPVNGPQADADGDQVAIAWFTQAQDTARVLLAFSRDAGATFAAPVRIDDGAPLGRVDVLLLDDGRAFVIWLERAGEAAEVRGRLISSNGEAGGSRVLGTAAASRNSGFPRMARSGSSVVLVWNRTGDEAGVNAAMIDLGG